MNRSFANYRRRVSRIWVIGASAAFILFGSLAAQADLGSAFKKVGDGVKKGTEDMKGSIENARDRHITKPATADEMAKSADQQLKDAQAQMFKDEKEKAEKQLIEAAMMITYLKEEAPEHERLKGLENRANKLAGDLKLSTKKDADIWARAKKQIEEEEKDAVKKAEEKKAEADKKTAEEKAAAEKKAAEEAAATQEKATDAAESATDAATQTK